MLVDWARSILVFLFLAFVLILHMLIQQQLPEDSEKPQIYLKPWLAGPALLSWVFSIFGSNTIPPVMLFPAIPSREKEVVLLGEHKRNSDLWGVIYCPFGCLGQVFWLPLHLKLALQSFIFLM